jgi:single-stranded DNA-binding protein
MAKLQKGDAVSVTGTLKPTTWSDKTTGETKTGLNVTVSTVLSVYDVKKHRVDTDKPATARTPRSQYQKPQTAHHAAKSNGYMPEPPPHHYTQDFNDALPFGN